MKMRGSAGCDFNVDICKRTLGVDEGGRVQQYVMNEIINQSEPYVPFSKGVLKSSVRIDGSDVIWGGAGIRYARYQWNGIVYEDPELHCAGFKTKDGWRSRKNVQKVPTERKLTYQNGSLRGDHWAEKMLRNGGRKKIEDGIRKMVGK